MNETSESPADTLALFRERFFGFRRRARQKTATTDTESSGEQKSQQNSSSTNTGTVESQAAESASSPSNEAAAPEIWRTRWDRAPTDWKRFLLSMPKQFGLNAIEEGVIKQRNATYVHTAPLTTRAWLGTDMVAFIVGTLGKFLLTNLNGLHTYNLPSLHAAIENRKPGRGLLTVSNHQSVMDDPFLMGAILPPRILLDSKRMRWGLCSLDICFQNAMASRFLRLGKALPIQRRGGLNQSFLLEAGEKLAAGDWVHVFPEGRVRQKGMGYYKRGVGKVLAMGYEAQQGLPLVIPFYHEGIENVMPQRVDSNKLQSPVPRTGNDLYVVVGEPLDLKPVFDRLMPACKAAGGAKSDAEPCLRLFEEVADFLAVTMRLLRAEARQLVQKDHGVDLGEPFEYS